MKTTLKKTETHSVATANTKAGVVIFCLSVDIQHKDSHLIDHVKEVYEEALLSGTKDYTREQIIDLLNSTGSSITASITQNVFSLKVVARKRHLRAVLDIVSSILNRPSFLPKEITRSKKLVGNLLNEAKEDAATIAKNNFANQLFDFRDRRHTKPLNKLIKEVPLVNKKDLDSLHTRVLQSYWTVSIIGTKDSIVNLENLVKEIKSTTTTEPFYLKHNHYRKDGSTFVLHNVPGRQNIEWSLGALVPITTSHEDMPALQFAISVLAINGGFAGRLMSTVREKEGLTYMIYGQIESVTDSEVGYWRVRTFFSPEQSVVGIKSTLKQIKALYNEGITKDEYKRFKKILETRQVLALDSIQKRFAFLHGAHLLGISGDEAKALQKAVIDVDFENVNKVIKKYFGSKGIIISGAGPVAKVEKDLEREFNKAKD